MQVYSNSKKDSIKTFLFFLLILVIAYLPVSSFLFFLKNDAFNGYFPPKFFMSESLRSGYLPLWNPYINFGLPQYGDMSSGFWSPVTWLLASTVGYNAYSFTIELLLYILFAGIGMYLLCRFYGMVKYVCLIAGLAYMCSGYMVGHLQHFNWLSGAACLPFCILAYHKLQSTFNLKHVLAACLAFYVLAASAHPGITIGSLYFFTGYALFVFLEAGNELPFSVRLARFTKSHALLLTGITLLGAGMIAGYADIIPHITRGEKVNEVASMANPVSPQSALSALLPLSIVKNDTFFATDLSMRNIYFTLTLFIFFILALFQHQNPYQRFFLVTGLVFLLLSSGGIFKQFAYHYLPLTGYVRLNGEFAIFVLLCFIIIAAFALNNHITAQSTFSRKLKIIYYLAEIGLFAAVIWGLYKVTQTHNSFTYQLKNISAHPGIPQKLKFLVDQLSFYDTLWLQGMIQLLLIWLIKWCLVNQRYKDLLKVCIADAVIATILNIPFTGVGQASLADVQTIINRSPKGIIVAPMQPVKANDTLGVYESGLVGNWSFYNKQIGVKEFAFYPIELNQSQSVFRDPSASIFNKPYLFFTSGDLSKTTMVTQFTGNRIKIKLKDPGYDTLVFQQNFYPHWLVVRDITEKIAPLKYNNIFLSTLVNPGTKDIEFLFDPSFIKKAMLVSAIAFLIFVVLVIILHFKSPSPSLPRQSLYP